MDENKRSNFAKIMDYLISSTCSDVLLNAFNTLDSWIVAATRAASAFSSKIKGLHDSLSPYFVKKDQ